MEPFENMRGIVKITTNINESMDLKTIVDEVIVQCDLLEKIGHLPAGTLDALMMNMEAFETSVAASISHGMLMQDDDDDDNFDDDNFDDDDFDDDDFDDDDDDPVDDDLDIDDFDIADDDEWWDEDDDDDDDFDETDDDDDFEDRGESMQTFHLADLNPTEEQRN